MKINSKHIAALLAASAMSFGLGAAAQPGPGGGMGPGAGMGPGGMGDCMMGGPGGMRGGKMMGDPAARAEQHLAQFKTQLKLTPQQEPLWQAFTEKVKAGAALRASHMQGMPQAGTAPERMDRMVQHMKEHTAAMEGTNEAFKRLYDALTPEQKAVADKYHPFADHMGQKRGPRRGGMGGPGGQTQAPAPR